MCHVNVCHTLDKTHIEPFLYSSLSEQFVLIKMHSCVFCDEIFHQKTEREILLLLFFSLSHYLYSGIWFSCIWAFISVVIFTGFVWVPHCHNVIAQKMLQIDKSSNDIGPGLFVCLFICLLFFSRPIYGRALWALHF